MIKGGLINWAVMGDPNASLPTPQPVMSGRCSAPSARRCAETCITFVSHAAHEAGIGEKLGLRRRVMPVYGTRTITKRSMVRNGNTPAST